ncbi:hypothetical protein ACWGB8_18620 [Kitasatospora sp. NPDC054939]
MTFAHNRRRRVAAYLRCYPYDPWEAQTHVRALEDHADALGFTPPRVLLDTVGSTCLVRPQLRGLLALAAAGAVDTVLVVGPWSFSIDDRTARSVTDFLASTGTEIVELPPQRLLQPRTAVPGVRSTDKIIYTTDRSSVPRVTVL